MAHEHHHSMDHENHQMSHDMGHEMVHDKGHIVMGHMDGHNISMNDTYFTQHDVSSMIFVRLIFDILYTQ